MARSPRCFALISPDWRRMARSGVLEECAVKGVIVRALSGGLIETATVGGFVQAGVFSVMN